jgi:hypothetical protein
MLECEGTFLPPKRKIISSTGEKYFPHGGKMFPSPGKNVSSGEEKSRVRNANPALLFEKIVVLLKSN